MLAAFDVARLHADFPEEFPSPEPPSLLLIAHRKEILLQALATFRQVLRDPSFGELYVDGAMPSQWRHVFASVQSLANRSQSHRGESDAITRHGARVYELARHRHPR